MLTILTFTFNAIANFALGLGVAYYLGAEEFGTFALVVATATVLQTLCFEWLRLSANRFYGDTQSDADPGIVATLKTTTGIIAIVLSAVALVLYLGGGAFGVTALVAGLAPLVAISSGLFDFRAGLARARFLHKRYATLVIVKQAIAMVLMLGGAYYWHRADYVLLGLCISALFGVLFSGRFQGEGGQHPASARKDLLRQFAVYAAPLIVASIIFQINMLMVRSGVALQFGMAESGRYSLALDLALKLVATIGSALDILLFQLAVRAEAEGDTEAARAQLAKNILIVVAIVLPACVGFWLVLPSVEALFVGKSYQGAFTHYTTQLLPGLFAYAMVQYVINPLFQIARKTTPVILAALFNFAVTASILFLVPGSDGGLGAIATSLGFIAGAVLMALLAWKIAPVNVPWGGLLKVGVATIFMGLAAWPLRGMSPGTGALIATAGAGSVAYLALCLGLNVGDARGYLKKRMQHR